MSELEKQIEELLYGNYYNPKDKARDIYNLFLDEKKKLKAEAVKVTEELRMEILISNAATYDYKFNIMAHRYNRKIESAIKKIEGL